MWESLGCSGVDKSVLSKVINGTRLFTPPQLEIFCSILKIPDKERDKLHYCLYMDQCKKLNIAPGGAFFIKSANIIETYQIFLSKLWTILYSGKCDEIITISDIITDQIYHHLFTEKKESRKTILSSMLIDFLFLKGRAIESISQDFEVEREINTTILNLKQVPKNKDSLKRKTLSYINLLKANAYYIKGSYSTSKNKAHYYHKSIDFSQKSIQSFNTNHTEIVFAFRTLLASQSFLSTKKELSFTFNKYKELLKKLFDKHINNINYLHLMGTFVKIQAKLGKKHPLDALQKIKNNARTNMTNKGIYEVSDIANEIEIIKLTGKGNKNYTKKLISKGISISEKYGFTRHKILLLKQRNLLIN